MTRHSLPSSIIHALGKNHVRKKRKKRKKRKIGHESRISHTNCHKVKIYSITRCDHRRIHRNKKRVREIWKDRVKMHTSKWAVLREREEFTRPTRNSLSAREIFFSSRPKIVLNSFSHPPVHPSFDFFFFSSLLEIMITRTSVEIKHSQYHPC